MNMKDSKEIYNLIIDIGKEFNISNCGMLAMDTMRMESGYLHWGHDISPEENQYQAGLQFTISYKKNIDFVGKKALLKIKDKTLSKNFVTLTLQNSKPGEPLMLHDEPIYLEDLPYFSLVARTACPRPVIPGLRAGTRGVSASAAVAPPPRVML